jgi:hypothetical protein
VSSGFKYQNWHMENIYLPVVRWESGIIGVIGVRAGVASPFLVCVVFALGFVVVEKLWAGVFEIDPVLRLQKLLLMIVLELELPRALSTLKNSDGLFSGDFNAEIIRG